MPAQALPAYQLDKGSIFEAADGGAIRLEVAIGSIISVNGSRVVEKDT